MEGDELTINKVRAAFGEALLEAQLFRGETTLVLSKKALPEVARFLRDDPELGYDRLLGLCGVDYLALGLSPRFAVVYHLLSPSRQQRLRLKVPVGEEEPGVPTVVDVWPAANWYEREAYDMFGLRFEGHPDLRRILMPDDWEGHPLRKDYPLGGEPAWFVRGEGSEGHG